MFKSESRANETGIEELRRIAKASEMCTESCFDMFSAAECIKLIRACWGSGWDILPDELTHEERVFASIHGRISDAARVRLEAVYG